VSTIGELTVCPFCKEEIAAGAIKCKHCHSNLAPMADEVEGANFSDAHVVEYNEPGVALGVIIVWSLYLFSFFLGVTTIIGVFVAFLWRWDAPEGSICRNHFDSQIKIFFKALFFLSVWFAMIFVIFMMGQMYLDFRLDLDISFWMILIGVSAYVFIMSVIGLVKFFGGKPYSSPMPTTAD